MAGADSEMPLVRRVGNLFFASLLNLVGCASISDSASGQRVLRREVLPQLYPLPDGLNFTPAMSTRALHENIKMVEVPIPYKERLGRSKLSVVHDGLRFLHAIVWTSLTYNPVRIFGGVGLLLLLMGVLLGGLGLAMGSADNVWPFPQLFASLRADRRGLDAVYHRTYLFNYVVSLFYRRTIRQGIFGRPLSHRPIERYFGLAGVVSVLLGLRRLRPGDRQSPDRRDRRSALVPAGDERAAGAQRHPAGSVLVAGADAGPAQQARRQSAGRPRPGSGRCRGTHRCGRHGAMSPNPPQSHYVLGWLIVLVSHNWPVMLAALATLSSAVGAWRRPSRRRLAFLYGSALFVLAYEYHKHVGPTLQEAANYLLMFELLWLNCPVRLLVGPVASATLAVAGAGFWIYAFLPRVTTPRP